MTAPADNYRLKPHNGRWYLQRRRLGFLWRTCHRDVGYEIDEPITFESVEEGKTYMARCLTAWGDEERFHRSTDGQKPFYFGADPTANADQGGE